MTRGRYWAVLLPFAAISCPLAALCMYAGSVSAEATLVAWILFGLAFVCPATVRRVRGAGVPTWIAWTILLFVCFACCFSSMVPLVAMRGIELWTYAATVTSFFVWLACSVPLVAVCLLPDKMKV
ncbi:hypothetical protein CRD59_07035 [Bifidobacterium xylocopae]|uniref:Uncharacterized protein n=1 Tax=Bifidobacterium xylocopae TaxID=2493119 RepID=A0A366KB67_9BIFI|nr:hypothetical protein CRD59_07035 [Bifidobacterium xylocopae]